MISGVLLLHTISRDAGDIFPYTLHQIFILYKPQNTFYPLFLFRNSNRCNASLSSGAYSNALRKSASASS